MKRILFLLILAALTIIGTGAVLAQPQSLVTVSGSAEVKVVPDEIFLNVAVETRDKELAEAKKQNDEHVSAALDFLKKNKVKETDVKTDYINIQPVYFENNNIYRSSSTASGGAGDNTKPVYYIVRKTIGIKITDVAKFDDLLSGLLASGVNSVEGVDFRTSELRKYRDQARSMAVKAAREKAQAMATELGAKLGKANSINENEGGGWMSWGSNRLQFGGQYQNSMMNGSQDAGLAGGSESGTISVGQISVTANVSVSFLIE
jgi:uncharacterized protein YggE